MGGGGGWIVLFCIMSELASHVVYIYWGVLLGGWGLDMCFVLRFELTS